jgi:aminoglycoside phosphotransferase (APT) family kinase protein
MAYIATHTTIPVPENIQFIEENGNKYLIMDYIDGKLLSGLWPNLREDAKKTILAELRDCVKQLRSLKVERVGGYVGPPNYGPRLDRRVVGCFHCSPFNTVRQFHDVVVATLRPTMDYEQREFLRNMMKDNHGIVFVHGDLHPGNILIHDGHVAAILDWEMARWYPEYWEWCKAPWSEKWELEGWCTSLKEFLQPYDYEYALDRLLLANSGAWW